MRIQEIYKVGDRIRFQPVEESYPIATTRYGIVTSYIANPIRGMDGDIKLVVSVGKRVYYVDFLDNPRKIEGGVRQ